MLSKNLIFVALVPIVGALGYWKGYTSMDNQSPSAETVKVSKKESHWFDGSVEQGFEKAASDGKLVLLYWGAEWCPPCHTLKDNVFSHPEFSSLADNFVAIYLDGDEEHAQRWGEELNVSGYPTVLLLDPSTKEEIVRLGSGLIFEDFKSSLLIANNRDVKQSDLIQKIKSTDLSAGSVLNKFTVAEVSYMVLFAKDVFAGSESEFVSNLDFLIALESSLSERETFVQSSRKVKAFLLDMSFKVSSAEEIDLDRNGEAFNRYKSTVKNLLGVSMLKDPDFVWEIRSLVSSEVSKVDEDFIAFYGVEKENQLTIKKSWIEAGALVRSNTKASASVRLWSLYPSVVLLKQNSESAANFSVNKQDVLTEISKITSAANGPHERGSTVTGAAYLYGELGEFDLAMDLLEAEVKTSDTPWYLYRALASLAGKKGDKKAQAEWVKLASSTAEGDATRLQWISSEISTLNEIGDPEKRMASLITDFIELSKRIDTAFSGRNYSSQKRVQKVISEKYGKGAEKQFDLSNYCATLKADASGKCSELYL